MSGLTSNRLRAWAVVVLIAVAPAGLRAADLPSGESLVRRFIERTASPKAAAAAKSSRTTGTIEVKGLNVKGTIESLADGDRTLIIINIQGLGMIEQGFDGEIAWEKNPVQGTRLVEGDEKALFRRLDGISLTDDWAKEYVSEKTLGEDTVNGKPVWKVEMTPHEGKPEIFYFDKDSGLLARMALKVVSPMGEVDAGVTLDDYRDVDGVQTAFSMTQNAMGQEIALIVDKVTYGVQIDPARFALPSDVAELVKKRKGQ